MKLKLITAKELEKLPTGTELVCIDGSKKVVGIDYIDDDTRGGFLAYGHQLPDDATNYDWDTSKWANLTSKRE